MLDRLSQLLDFLSEKLANRKGLLPLIGIGLILLNLLLQFIPGLGFLSSSNIFLHLGVIVAILGFMLARVL